MLSQQEFIRLVKNAYAKTGLTPQRDLFCSDINGKSYACAIGALVNAYGRRPECQEGDWIAQAQKCVRASYDFYDGVITGFDGYTDSYLESEEFQRGVEYGQAVARELFDKNANKKPAQEPATLVMAAEQSTQDTMPLALAP